MRRDLAKPFLFLEVHGAACPKPAARPPRVRTDFIRVSSRSSLQSLRKRCHRRAWVGLNFVPSTRPRAAAQCKHMSLAYQIENHSVPRLARSNPHAVASARCHYGFYHIASHNGSLTHAIAFPIPAIVGIRGIFIVRDIVVEVRVQEVEGQVKRPRPCSSITVPTYQAAPFLRAILRCSPILARST